MNQKTIRFEFQRNIHLVHAWQTASVARFAVEGQFGAARVKLEVQCRRLRRQHAIEITGSEEIASAFAQAFTGLLNREFGERAFQVRRLSPAGKAIAG